MITLFDNQSIGKCICVDWDLYYSDFLKEGIPAAISLMRYLKDVILSGEEVRVYHQQSPGGNTHLAIKFDRPLSVLDGFMIRAWMGDDSQRLRLDMARYAKTGSLYEMNRCFQNKIKVTGGQGTLFNAGEWVGLDIPVADPRDIPTTSQAHTMIIDLVRKREHENRGGS